MPVVNLSPIARRQYFDSNGDPVVGGKLFYYAAGSSTKQNTYTDSSGTVANSNPIVLDASGRTPQGVWFEAGLIYKEVLALATDTDPPTSPIYTADGLEGVNDTTTPAALASSSQWVASGLTPTYVSATQFTLVGDQTAAFHVGRRLRLTVTAGTVYGRISVTAFGALTTVTVVLDSGALDAGLSAVDVGILTALNNSLPEPSSVGIQPLDAQLTTLAGITAQQATDLAAVSTFIGTMLNDADAATARDTLVIESAIKPITATVAANALTLGLGSGSLNFRNTPLTSGTVNTRSIAAAISLVVPSTATLGTINATAARLVLIALDNAGTVELAVANLAGGLNLDETTLISTTAISAAADSANVVYSTTARTSLPFRVVGFIDITEATAGTWATAPSTIQGAGGQALAAMASVGYGQTWQNVTASRASEVVYYNTTGKPITVAICASNATSYIQLIVDGVIASFCTDGTAGVSLGVEALVPPGSNYKTNAVSAIANWAELR